MSKQLRYYLAFNGGLEILEYVSGSILPVWKGFDGRTVEHLTGSRQNPQTVFAAVAFDGGYRTLDGGRTWKKVLEGDVRTITIDPKDDSVVYAGSGPVRLYRSEDCGGTWEPLDGLLALPDDVKSKWTVPERLRKVEHPHVRHIFVHPDDSNFIFLVLEHGGVVLSLDGGKSWQDRSDGIAYLDMHVLRNCHASRDRFYVSSARGFYRSDDCGYRWQRVETGMPWANSEFYSYSHEWLWVEGVPPRLVVCTAKGSPFYWATEKRPPQGRILWSDDGAENWQEATVEGVSPDIPWMPWVLVSHPTDDKTLFVGMGDGSRGFGFDARQKGSGCLYRSRDRGESWEPVLQEMPSILTAWIASS
jgi:photosystem II stability/assembly factor-like uncharacterized protein